MVIFHSYVSLPEGNIEFSACASAIEHYCTPPHHPPHQPETPIRKLRFPMGSLTAPIAKMGVPPNHPVWIILVYLNKIVHYKPPSHLCIPIASIGFEVDSPQRRSICTGL